MNSLIVIRSYLKKSRLQISVIILMLVLASLVLGLALILQTDYKNNFFRTHDRLSSEHIMLDYYTTGLDSEQYISEKLSADGRIASFEITPAAFCRGNCRYGKDGLLTSLFDVMRFSEAENKSIGRFEITDEISVGDGYIPYIFKANGFYEAGDSFTVNLGGIEKTFVIKGFYNNLMTGTVNCREVALLLTDEKYEELAAAGCVSGYCISVRLTEPEKAETMESEIINELSDEAAPVALLDSANYIKLSGTRYVSETVFTGILCSAAAVIAVVLLAIVAVSLSNYIKENMRNLGIMKAVGYESRGICGPIILLLTFLAGLASCIGYALAYCLLPLINGILESQSGIPYEIRFLALPGLITVGIMLASVSLTALFSILKIRTILPIMAIRPVKTRTGTVTVLPLQKSKGNLNLTLGLKTVFSEPKKYVIFLVTSFLITVMLCVAAYSTDNILNHPENIVSMVMGNSADVSLNVSVQNEQELNEWLSGRDDVSEAYVYTHGSVCHEGGGKIDAVIRDSKANRASGYLLTEGSFPENDTEVAVNFAYAAETGLSVGDEMTLIKDGREEQYRICGLFQDASSSGKNIALFRSGYEKLTALTSVSYLVTLTDEADIDDFINEICAEVPVTAVNYRDFISGMSATYVSMLKVLIIIIIVISLMIATMVLSVIVNMILFNKRREHGIMKSLGFITPQIILQTAVSFVPVAVCGSLVGLVVSYRGVSLLFSSFVRSVGIYSFGDSTAIPYLIACGLLFTVFTFAITCLMSLKIKETVPHDLFNNE